MKKYSKEWIEYVRKNLNGSSLNPETVLHEMEQLGMLRNIPEPLEVEYCRYHGAAKHSNDHRCYISINYYDINKVQIEDCKFIKLREVVE